MKVQHVMSCDVVTVGPDERAWVVAEMLARLELTGLPVVDCDRHLLGVVTEYDLIRALRQGTDLRDVAACDIMQPRTLFIEPETEMEQAADLLLEYQVRRLPVCQDGRVVGVVSRGDVLWAMLTVSFQQPC
jgi:CBS domain-containing protein